MQETTVALSLKKMLHFEAPARATVTIFFRYRDFEPFVKMLKKN